MFSRTSMLHNHDSGPILQPEEGSKFIMKKTGKVFKILLKNYSDTICEIIMHAS